MDPVIHQPESPHLGRPIHFMGEEAQSQAVPECHHVQMGAVHLGIGLIGGYNTGKVQHILQNPDAVLRIQAQLLRDLLRRGRHQLNHLHFFHGVHFAQKVRGDQVVR